jgi:hypothetical protein
MSEFRDRVADDTGNGPDQVRNQDNRQIVPILENLDAISAGLAIARDDSPLRFRFPSSIIPKQRLSVTQLHTQLTPILLQRAPDIAALDLSL